LQNCGRSYSRQWSQVARVQDVTLWRLDAKAEITSRR